MKIRNEKKGHGGGESLLKVKGREHSQRQERDPELPCGEKGERKGKRGVGGRYRHKEGKRLKRKGW